MSSCRFLKSCPAVILATVIFLCATASSVRADDDPFMLNSEPRGATLFQGQAPVFEDVRPMDPEAPDAFLDIPQNHWAYKAVKYLIDIGLLGGYDDGLFRGDRPVSRYELSVLIAKLVSNYNRYMTTGSFMPAAPAGATPIQRIEPPSSVQPAADDSITVISRKKSINPKFDESMVLAQIPEQPPVAETLARGKPRMMEIPKEEKPPEAPPKEEKKQEPPKTEKKDEKPKTPLKPPKEFSKLDKSVELTEKDVKILEALVEYLKKDILNQLTDQKKKIAELDRQEQINKRDIDKLKEENDRFRVTGSAEA
ncbi:MAG TPA: S-layer homology domain-containing protein, partial [bacterium]|nr:S-layer homology domain-containing protein [bacterium]